MFSPALVEFLGTSLLVGTVSFTGVPVLIVAALAVAIGFGGKVSGGHFNPAVSIVMASAGKISTTELIPYCLAQILGGLVAL